MSRAQLLEHVRELYRKHGPGVLTYSGFKQQGTLYTHAYNKGLTLDTIIGELGARDAVEQYKREASWDGLVHEAKTIAVRHGHLPPAAWFQSNGQSWLVGAVYAAGKNWNDLRTAVDSFAGSNFVASRNGMRWLSHAEASLSNFLHARGIAHKRGERYSEGYAEMSGRRFGLYDLHFRNRTGDWVDVEIWGGKPSHDSDDYAEKRRIKEQFNETNPRFIGIEHRDCMDDARLAEILRPHVGDVPPFIFDGPIDKVVPSTHWSNVDELLAACREIASQQPDGTVPTEGWLRKRGRFSDRPGPAYNTLSVYVKLWVGGVRPLRKLLGQQDASTNSWTRETAVAAFKSFYDRFGVTPGQAKARPMSGMSDTDRLLAQNICGAVEKYAGGVRALTKELGISVEKQTKWNAERVLETHRQFFTRFSMTPRQIASLSDDRRRVFGVSEADVDTARSVADAVHRYFPGGAREVLQAIGAKPIDIRTLEKRITPADNARAS